MDKIDIFYLVFLTLSIFSPATSHPTNKAEDKGEVPINRERRAVPKRNEQAAEFWIQEGQDTLKARLAVEPVKTRAKNVVLFVGDGMSIPTLVAARIFKGQSEGSGGEEQTLSFERFPHTGLAKTYCVNAQVGESACTATALMAGVKTNDGAIGIDASKDADPANRVSGIVTWAQAAGMRTGLVTTTRVTHATPAGAYAHVPDRDWESDSETTDAGAGGIWDIAKQLVSADPGKNMNVVLGGGRRSFENRVDGEDLIQTWKNNKKAVGKKASFVASKKDLQAVPLKSTDFLFGLFDKSHLPYHLDADLTRIPTLAEMVEAAVTVLQNGPKGFFLLVEGGRIDHGHHENKAHLALDETVQMSLAVESVLRMTDAKDTLVVVTADHAHTMSMSGYADRGASIFSTAGEGADGLPYATLSYANGPGHMLCGNQRCDLGKDDLTAKNYAFPATVLLDQETHGGDDVAVFATGPWSHLFGGMYEQNYIPHALAYAACIGDGPKFCDSPPAIPTLTPTTAPTTTTPPPVINAAVTNATSGSTPSATPSTAGTLKAPSVVQSSQTPWAFAVQSNGGRAQQPIAGSGSIFYPAGSTAYTTGSVGRTSTQTYTAASNGYSPNYVTNPKAPTVPNSLYLYGPNNRPRNTIFGKSFPSYVNTAVNGSKSAVNHWAISPSSTSHLG